MYIKKLIQITILFSFVFFAIPSMAQTEVISDSWDDFDFNDTALISSNVLKNKVISYIFESACSSDAHFDTVSIASMNMVFGKAKSNMKVYEYLLELMLNGYSNLGRTQVVDYLLNYPMLFEGEISIEQGLRLDSISEPFQLVKVGAKSPDFMGITIDGRPYHLYASEVKHTIVAFWSTDCEYCHEFLNNIRKKLDLRSEYELVTFALAEHVEEVEDQLNKMQLFGFHFYDEKRWDSEAFLDFHVTSIPTVFLLDVDKNIVCKPYDWAELKDWIKKTKQK